MTAPIDAYNVNNGKTYSSKLRSPSITSESNEIASIVIVTAGKGT